MYYVQKGEELTKNDGIAAVLFSRSILVLQEKCFLDLELDNLSLRPMDFTPTINAEQPLIIQILYSIFYTIRLILKGLLSADTSEK